jgi:superfamily I DNA and/or RNA helicase
MALRKNVLLEDLDQLREKIKEDEKFRTGRTPVVCSDQTLLEIAKKKPLKISDFLAIQGIGKKFMDEYSSMFLQVILKHKTSSIKEEKISRSAYKVLDHYKDRLTNISRRNPNLYMGKTTKKASFDLSSLDFTEELIRFLTNKRVQNLQLTFPRTVHGDSLERHVVTMYRETNKDEKETGSYDLYIAYPYVEGVFKKDQFAIRAPLLYFPVKLTRSKRDFIIKKDKDKDIIYNRDLLLATSKMEKNDVDSNTPFIQDFSLEELRKTVIPYYQKNGFNIVEDKVSFDFEQFNTIQKDQFVKRVKGIFDIKEYITIGRYKLYSSMIQKDMSLILDSNKYNHLLEGLIDEQGLDSEEQQTEFLIENAPVRERRLSYVNEINYAQEKVIDLVHKEEKLVIWGPPGTGKSQTITSLIASSVLRGENVLIVSEKKVALDVIYSRLKQASKYAMFIDDAENKQDFYQKIKDILNPVLPQRTINNDVFELEEEIKEILHTMDKSLDLLYNYTIQDTSISKLYKRYVRDNNIIKGLEPLKVHNMFIQTFKNPLFKELDAVESTFDKKRTLTDHLEYEDMLSKYPVLSKLEVKVSRSNRLDFEEFHQEYIKYKDRMKYRGFFKRRKITKEFLNSNANRLLFLTVKPRVNKKYMKVLLNDDTLHNYIYDNITKLSKTKKQHNELTKPERVFLRMLLTHPLLKDIKDVSQYRHYLFDAFYTGYLEEFKTTNQKYLYIFDKYQEKIDELEQLIQKKRQVTEESVEMELYKHALNFNNSKRIMDIRRILESSRKLSVKAFIDVFQMELMNNIRIWMMTPEVVSATIPLIYGMFDLVIFDEASQMYVEKGIPAIYRAKKVVIAGDTKQLRPSSLGIGRLEDDDEFYEDDTLKDVSMDAKSLLDLSRYKYHETILNYHYRSVYEELIAFSNHAFYDGKLIVSPNQQESSKPPIEYIYVKDGIFDNRKNKEESKQVIKLLRKIFKERENNETIGVITFNSTQRDQIENDIDEELFKKGKYQKIFERELFRTEDGEDKSLFVKNIENVQGDERDIIIFSMGYARDNEGYVRRRFGWLNNDGGQNRLNVAISRAKKKIYFVSSLLPEELKVEDLKSTGPKLLKDYMRYCYYVSNKQSDLAKGVLDKLHPFEESNDLILGDMVSDIQRRLERNGFTVKTSIGIGKYSINLAIVDEETNTYKLGIICDVDNVKEYDARRDLFHQEKYLKARNWSLYRVFASNWYVDPNKEMRNIREQIKAG